MKQNLKRPKLVHGVMLLLMLLFSGFTTFNLQAQSQIKGTVLDAGGNPIPGVSILQKGTNNGVVTDFDGIYSMNIKSGQKILIFSYLGYNTQEVNVAGKVKLNVVMEESAETLDEIVIVGYQAVKRDNILGAVSNVKAASIEEAAPVDALQGVQGKLSGVQIISNNGPGEGFDIRIRGVSTLTAGATGPLYVVDGQQTFNIDNLDPADIESLEVLKDGASTAIYGSQGGNGVVLITTKSGKAGQIGLTVTSVTGVNSLVGQIPAANAAQRIDQERVRGIFVGGGGDSLTLLARNSPDIQRIVTRPALRNQVNLALSGGSEKARFYWNTGFFNEEGLIINSGHRRVNTRLRLDLTPNEKLTLGTNVNLSFEQTDRTSSGQTLVALINRIAYLPLFEPDGSFVPGSPRKFSLNPIQNAELRKNQTRTYRANLSTFAKFNFTDYLSVRSSVNVDLRYIKAESFAPSVLDPRDFNLGIATGGEDHSVQYRIQQDNVLNFDKTFGKGHNFKAFLGNQLTRNRTDRLNITAEFVSDDIDTFNNTQAESVVVDTAGGNQTQETGNTLFSLFAGFNYDFEGKYLLGATIRRDGSSRFGENNRFGYFPSGSIGWNIGKEDFLKNNKIVKRLLIRYSYGIVGNDRIPNFDFVDQLSPGFLYNGLTGVAPVVSGNPNIQWEEQESQNLGFDLSLFKGRKLNLSVDFWRKQVNGLLVPTNLPRSSGFNTIRENRGDIRNQGVDIAIDGTIYKKKGFSYTAGFNVGILENKVTRLDTPIFTGRFVTEEGGSIGNIYGHANDGVYQWDESNAYDPTSGERLLPNFDGNGLFLGTYNRQDGTAYPVDAEIRQLVHSASGKTLRGGDYIWEDLNNDGEVNSDDRRIIGNGLPTVTGGFNHKIKYKNFTLSTLFDYNFGNDIYRLYDADRDALRASVITASPDRFENAWTNQGDITTYPLFQGGNLGVQNRLALTGQTANSSYVTSGDFIKWRYIRLGYNFPKDLVNDLNLGLSSLKLDLAINNVLTWTNYEGYNPEFGTRGNPLTPSQDNLRYPNDREFLLTLKVQF